MPMHLPIQEVLDASLMYCIELHRDRAKRYSETLAISRNRTESEVPLNRRCYNLKGGMVVVAGSINVYSAVRSLYSTVATE